MGVLLLDHRRFGRHSDNGSFRIATRFMPSHDYGPPPSVSGFGIMPPVDTLLTGVGSVAVGVVVGPPIAVGVG